MINWDSLISRNAKVVKEFAVGRASSEDFVTCFRGNPNEARRLVRTNGATYGRRLARKALRRRGLLS